MRKRKPQPHLPSDLEKQTSRVPQRSLYGFARVILYGSISKNAPVDPDSPKACGRLRTQQPLLPEAARFHEMPAWRGALHCVAVRSAARFSDLWLVRFPGISQKRICCRWV